MKNNTVQLSKPFMTGLLVGLGLAVAQGLIAFGAGLVSLAFMLLGM